MLQVRHTSSGSSNFYGSTQKYSSFEAIQCCGDSREWSLVAIWWHVCSIFKTAALSSKAMIVMVAPSSMAVRMVETTAFHSTDADNIKLQLGTVTVTSCAKYGH